MIPGARRTGLTLRVAAGDVARAWRASRSAARPAVFPGLLDGFVEGFVSDLGMSMAQGRHPALVWPGAEGVVRVDARGRNRKAHLAELEAEWDLLREVLVLACRRLGADDTVLGWLDRALLFARAASRTLPHDAPPGVLAVRVLGGWSPTARGRG